MTSKELSELPLVLQDYFTYISAIRERSSTTIDEYFLDLRTFFRFIKQRRGLCSLDVKFEDIDLGGVDAELLRSITINDVFAFLSYCKNERGNGAKSRARKAAAIRQFFKYSTDRIHLLEENPVSQLDSPKVPKSLPKYLSLDQSIALLNAVDGKYKARDYAIVTLFLNCGLRLSELCGINLNDISPDSTLRVTGKGNKQRIVYLNDACINAINNYLKVRPTENIKDKNALFISRLGNRISQKTVQHNMYQLFDKAGLGSENFSVHKLRHTAATLMYQYGEVDILVLKELLGHENLNTTEIYTHLTNEQIKEAAKKNPLSKIGVKK